MAEEMRDDVMEQIQVNIHVEYMHNGEKCSPFECFKKYLTISRMVLFSMVKIILDFTHVIRV